LPRSPGIAAAHFSAPFGFVRFGSPFFLLTICATHLGVALHRHFEHRPDLARLFLVDQKLFGQRGGIIAQWQRTADPPAFAFERRPGVGDTLCNQLALEFSEN